MNPEIGDRFGKLTVTGGPVSRNGRYWPCKCDCGGDVWASITSLRSRAASGGACAVCARIKHGHGSSSDSTYSKYQAMKARCLNRNHKDFPNYGGRGIAICARWLEAFEHFLADMGEAPAGMTIERERVDEGYEPGNCRWATRLEQSRNARSNIQVAIGGVKYGTLSEAAQAHGSPYSTVRIRIKSYGWSIERALTTPVDEKKRRQKGAL
jgi:hypothetical protein